MKRLPVLLLAAALVALPGCGGSDDSAPPAAGDTATSTGAAAADQTITVNWGAEPPSLDPGLVTDTTSSNILLNVMDPLVKLDDELNPVASLAESWETSDDGLTVTFHLRGDGRWTNGDPVTAEDFEWSWKRTISPELAADYDETLAEARRTADDNERYDLYGQLEDKLLGEGGAVPMAPIYWYTYVNLERPSIQDTFDVNLLSQTDLTKVVVQDD